MRPSLSAPVTISGSRILGVGTRRPDRIVTNDELGSRLDTDPKLILKSVGIIERRFAAEDESLIDMAVLAGQEALADAGISASQVDAVIVPNSTMLAQIPNAAGRVAHRIRADVAGAFDLNAGCAGFTYGLAVASDLVRAGTARYVLVIAAEKTTDVVNPLDRKTAIIFGDGAGAALVGPSTTIGIGPVAWGNAGNLSEALTMRDGYFHQDGQTIFRWAVDQMPKVALQAMQLAGITAADVDVVLPHQANLRIIRSVESSLRAKGLRDDVIIADDIQYSGNTSAACIPIALDALRRDARVRSGDIMVMVSVGAGLTYAGQVVICP